MEGGKKAKRKRAAKTVFAEWMKSSLFKTEHCRELHVAVEGRKGRT
jgi:hypothetical protein